LLIAVLVLVPSVRASESHRTRWSWSYSALMQRIVGARVPMPGRRIVVDRDLVICSGQGKPLRLRTGPRWKHFTCTQTLFRNGIDKDVTFRVHVRGQRRFAITDVRYGPD